MMLSRKPNFNDVIREWLEPEMTWDKAEVGFRVKVYQFVHAQRTKEDEMELPLTIIL